MKIFLGTFAGALLVLWLFLPVQKPVTLEKLQRRFYGITVIALLLATVVWAVGS
jgi:hypothetical protein